MPRKSTKSVKPFVFAASISDTSDITTTTTTEVDRWKYGPETLDKTNRYLRYMQLTMIDAYVHGGLTRLGLSAKKGFSIYKEGEKEDAALKEARAFSEKFELEDRFGDVCRLLSRDGSVPILSVVKDNVDGIVEISYLPMRYTTFLTKSLQQGEDNKIIFDSTMIKGDIHHYCVNEGLDTQELYEAKQVELVRIFNEGYECTDIQNRATLGVYGQSLLEPIDNVVRYRQNLMEGYTKALMRYGNMKLWFEYNMLAELLKERAISVKDAKRLLTDAASGLKNMEANKDIVTTGFNVKSLNPEGRIEIGSLKESFEKEISQALCMIEVDAGKGGDTSFGASYIANNRSYLVIESIRKKVKRSFERIIHRHLEAKGFSKVDDIKIRLEPLVQPAMSVQDLLAMNKAKMLNDGQLFNIIGFGFQPKNPEAYSANEADIAAAERNRPQANMGGAGQNEYKQNYRRTNKK